MFLGSIGASEGILLMWDHRVVEKTDEAVGDFSVLANSGVSLINLNGLFWSLWTSN
jgi:hypothetical protein